MIFVKFLNMYTLEFPKIKALQEKKTLQYDICKTKCSCKDFYGIRIRCMNDLGLCEVLEPKISENKEIVSAIIEYLYANSVDEVNFNDVLHDVIYKLKLESLKDSANNK